MKRLSTQCMNEIENKTNRNRKERKTMPRRQTLDFLTHNLRGFIIQNPLYARNSVV